MLRANSVLLLITASLFTRDSLLAAQAKISQIDLVWFIRKVDSADVISAMLSPADGEILESLIHPPHG